MRRIAMVLGGKFPPDIRVEKEAMVLIDAGFEIYIFAFGKRIVDEYNKIKIYSCERTPFFPKRAVENMRFFAFHYHPKFATFIRAGIEKLKPDAIHIHDIPFFKTAYLAGKLLNTKFVLDLHENYPAALLEYRKGKRGIEWF
ncbi:MAG: glycosyltransferase, partial [bacterium]